LPIFLPDDAVDERECDRRRVDARSPVSSAPTFPRSDGFRHRDLTRHTCRRDRRDARWGSLP